jgi:hypothetical protein
MNWGMARAVRYRRRAVRWWVIGMVATAYAAPFADAADPQPDGRPPGQAEAWRTSPYHGATNGSGLPIPCRCRHGDRSYNLGDKVCLQMPNGVVLARCDMFQNNTSWIATEEACTLSWHYGPTRNAQSFARKS